MSKSISMTSTEYTPLPLTMEDIRDGMKEYFIRDGKNFASINGKKRMLLVYSKFLIDQKYFNLSEDDLKYIFNNLVQI